MIRLAGYSRVMISRYRRMRPVRYYALLENHYWIGKDLSDIHRV